MPRERADATENVQGTQSVQRAVAILRLVAQGGDDGRRASEIAALLDLNLATTERLLRALAQEQLVQRDAATRHYRIGPEITALGASRLRRFSLAAYFEPALAQIAGETGDTAFLWARSGDEAICVARREGGYPIRALAIEVGDRRPLGVGAGPLAQLAFMPAPRAGQIVARQAAAYAAFGLSRGKVETMVERAQALGFAFNEGEIVPEMGSIGVPIRDAADELIGSISVAAIISRMHRKRAAHVAATVVSIVTPLLPVAEN